MRQVGAARMAPVTVERYLLPHERSCITVRMHPASLAGPFLVISGGLAAARKLSGRSARPDIVWGAYLLLLLDFSRRVAAWPVTYFVVTDQRMLLIRGALSHTVAVLPLDKATGLMLQRTVLGRLLGYGSLIVTSPGRRPAFRKVRYVPYPEQLYLEVSGLLSPDEVASPEQGEDASSGVDLDPGF